MTLGLLSDHGLGKVKIDQTVEILHRLLGFHRLHMLGGFLLKTLTHVLCKVLGGLKLTSGGLFDLLVVEFRRILTHDLGQLDRVFHFLPFQVLFTKILWQSQLKLKFVARLVIEQFTAESW